MRSELTPLDERYRELRRVPPGAGEGHERVGADAEHHGARRRHRALPGAVGEFEARGRLQIEHADHRETVVERRGAHDDVAQGDHALVGLDHDIARAMATDDDVAARLGRDVRAPHHRVTHPVEAVADLGLRLADAVGRDREGVRLAR